MAACSSWEDSDGTNTKRFSHPLHANSLLAALNDNRKLLQFCDGVVCVSGEEIPVQKNVLAATSPYFRALYSYEHSPANSVQQTKVLPNLESVDSKTFQQILDYVYTSVVILNEENIQAILQAADVLLMTDLKDLCCEYLEQCISPANCLGIGEFTERFSCPRVHHLAKQCMEENFCEMSYSEEFMQLTMEKLKQVLQADSLNVQTENVICDAVMRWVRQDSTTRGQYLQELLGCCVHVGCLDDCYVYQQIIVDELIQSRNLQAWLLNVRKNDRTSRQRGYTNVVIAAGGEGPNESTPSVVEIKNTVRCVAPASGPVAPWIDLAPMLQPRIGHGLVQAGGCLYAVGGRDNSGRILNSGEKYNPVEDRWTSLPPMEHARVGFGLVTIDDKIYAIGGSNDMSDPLTSMEEFNIYTNKWHSLPDMNLKRAWSAYAVANKKIYVIGGGIMGKLYESVECFDPRSETWISVAPMKERRFDARSIGLGDNIYVFGGLRRLECPSAMQGGSGMKFCGTEMYSCEQKIWSSINRCTMGMCTMTESSHIDAILQCQEEVLVVGELDVGGVYQCIRSFQPGTNSWRGVVHNHPPNQRGMQSAMLRVPNNVIYRHLWNQGKLTFTDIKK